MRAAPRRNAPAEQSRERDRDGGARSAVFLILVVKLLVLWFGIQAFIILADQSRPTFRSWIEIWNRWDAPHYLDIARDGYVTTGEERRWIVFFPLFPWLVRAAAWILRDPLVAAFFVSTIASLVAAALLYRLARLDDDERTSLDAVFFLAIFPTSYFLHIGYTESLFLALILGSFLAARRGNWAVAGVTGAFAAFARVNGLLLIPALALEAWSEYRRTRERNKQWMWIALVAAGFAGYLVLNEVVTGDWFTFQRYQREHWHRSLAMPWTSIGESWTAMFRRAPGESLMVGWQELLFTGLTGVCAIWSWIRLRPSYAAWITLNLLLWTSTSFLLSVPRYAIAAFPIFLWFARGSSKRPLLRAALTVWSLLFLALFASLFVQGKWAF